MSRNRWEFAHGDETRSVSLRHISGDHYLVHVGERAYDVLATRLPDGRVRCTIDDETFEADSAAHGDALQVRVAGRTWQLAPAIGRTRADAGGNGIVEAPMTGTIEKVLVARGDKVESGATIAVLTAMKMEHKLTAGIDGVVAEIAAEVGAAVAQGAVLARIEAE